jgi:hypothetical protein
MHINICKRIQSNSRLKPVMQLCSVIVVSAFQKHTNK